MIRLLGLRASPFVRQRLSAIPRNTRSVSLAAPSPTNAHAGLIVRDGKAVLYRGPPAQKKSVYYFIGGIFIIVGANSGYSIYTSFSWPIIQTKADNPPKLIGLGKRMVMGGIALMLGLATSWFFIVVPTKTITKLTLDVPARQLIMRTSAREFSALLPKPLFPRPFRTTAELEGYYKTDRVMERIVPLSSVYRIRGSALTGTNGKNVGMIAEKKGILADDRLCVELRVGDERATYILETLGGADPPKGGGYAGFWRRIVHRLRGKTEWEGQKGQLGSLGDSLGDKEPWFANRKTFDDVIPLIKRR